MPTGQYDRKKSKGWQAYVNRIQKQHSKPKIQAPSPTLESTNTSIASRLIAMGTPNPARFYTLQEWQRIAENFDQIKGTPEGEALAQIAILSLPSLLEENSKLK